MKEPGEKDSEETVQNLIPTGQSQKKKWKSIIFNQKFSRIISHKQTRNIYGFSKHHFYKFRFGKEGKSEPKEALQKLRIPKRSCEYVQQNVGNKQYKGNENRLKKRCLQSSGNIILALNQSEKT